MKMDIISFFSIVAIVIYLALGITVFVGNHRRRAHRLFLLMALSLAITLVAVVFARNTQDKESALRWMRLGIFGLIPFFSLSLHFSMEITLKTRQVPDLSGLIYLQPLTIVVFHVRESVLYSDFLRVHDTWCPVHNTGYIGYHIFIISSVAMLIATAGFILFTFLRTDMVKKRRQAAVLLFTFAATIVGSLTVGLFLPALTRCSILGLSTVFFLIWYLGFYIAMRRYGFLSDTPESLRADVIDNVDDAIILLDRHEKINLVNKRAGEVLGLSTHDLKAKDISGFIVEHKKVMKLVVGVQQGKYRDLSCRVIFLNENGENAAMDCRFSVALDRFGDSIGTLMIGRTVRGSQYLKKSFRITAREAEVIEYIFEGKTNREISDEIGVTINTLKSHIQHIYNKLSVDNKLKLLKLIADLDLVPEQRAEKKVLILPK